MTRARKPTLDQRVRHLLGDLSRAETRGAAVKRIRRRVGTEVGSRLAGDAAGSRPGPASAGPSAAEARAAARAAGEATLARSIAGGEPLERAAARAMNALADSLEFDAAWSLAEGIGRLPNGGDASAIAHLVLLHRRRQLARGWPIVRELDPVVARRFAPLEAVDAALAAGGAKARARALEIGIPSEDHDAATLVGLAGRFLAFGERDRAAALVAAARGLPTLDLDLRRRRVLDLIEGWLVERTPTVPDGAIPFAVLGYASPDPVLTSGNLGDSVQTLGMLANLVRHGGITFTGGDDGLGALATELQGRVRPGLRVADGSGSVHLVPVDRDFSSAAVVPPDTWMLAFGWHMHPLFDLRYDFPYHPNLRPLYLSFHVNRLDMLSDVALEELRQHGPIGCRDWSTVFLLLSAGVDAFFSGCVSLTIDALYPARSEAYAGNGPIGLIDVAPHAAGNAKHVRTYGHQDDRYAVMPLTEGLRAADTALAGYQRLLDRAITNRLHAYLPLTALGVPVDFRPGRKGDIRFAGLMGLAPDDDRVTAIRAGIRELVDGALAKILAGCTPDEVYAHWREATRERVAEAKARFAAPARDPETTIDVAESVADVLASARQLGPATPVQGIDAPETTHVVVAFDEALLQPAAVLVESLVTQSRGPLHLWILARGIPDAYVDWLGRAFPDLPITVLPCDRLTYGAKGRPYRIPKRISISTMDRLFLPGLLPDIRRVVYLDVDTLALDDIGKLARVDLGGRPIAARDTALSEAASWQAAVRPLDEPVATEFRRAMAHRHGFGGACLNAGVLVMDLDRMRRDDFTRLSLARVETYGLHDQDAMLAYTGPERQLLDSRWNALPVLEDVADPGLIHWAAMGKPWSDDLAFGQDLWREVADRLKARAGRPPAT